MQTLLTARTKTVNNGITEVLSIVISVFIRSGTNSFLADLHGSLFLKGWCKQFSLKQPNKIPSSWGIPKVFCRCQDIPVSPYYSLPLSNEGENLAYLEHPWRSVAELRAVGCGLTSGCCPGGFFEQ